jgi:hypothetical protein
MTGGGCLRGRGASFLPRPPAHLSSHRPVGGALQVIIYYIILYFILFCCPTACSHAVAAAITMIYMNY